MPIFLKLLVNRQAVVTKAVVSLSLLARQSSSLAESQESKVVLYQYKICPFCSRVKSLLDYMDVPYDSVEVSPLTKSQLSFTTHKKVPVAKIDNNIIAESADIISYLLDPKKFPQGIKLSKSFLPDDSEQWTLWSEKKLAVMLYPNITRTYNESWECFNYTSSVTSWSYPERKLTHILGAFFMSLANGKIKKKYGIINEREELKTVLNEWTTAIDNKDFLHGSDLTLPDLMVYGVLRSIVATQTFREIMADNKVLQSWYIRVDNKLPRHSQ